MTREMLISTLKFVATPERWAEIRRIVRSLNGPLESAYGCSSSRLYLEAEDACRFILLQEWPVRREMERFVASREYLKVLALMELATDRPELKFHQVTCSTGLETVNSLRVPRGSSGNDN